MGNRNSTPSHDCSCILEDSSLWLSSHHPARDKEFLQGQGITHILAITHTEAVHFPDSFEYNHLPFVDNRAVTLSDHFAPINQWIDDARKHNGRVLVHCEAGMSRSATLVIGYLLGTSDSSIKMHSVKEAFGAVSARRSVIQPNYGFIQQLLEYSERLGNEAEPLFYAQYIIDVMRLGVEGVTAEQLSIALSQNPDNIPEAILCAMQNKGLSSQN